MSKTFKQNTIIILIFAFFAWIIVGDHSSKPTPKKEATYDISDVATRISNDILNIHCKGRSLDYCSQFTQNILFNSDWGVTPRQDIAAISGLVKVNIVIAYH